MIETYNRVLVDLGHIPMRGYETKEGQKGGSRDGSFIPYIVEELIARSAYQVVFNFKSDSFADSVPAALKGRVDWVDGSKSRRKAQEYLSPLFEELFIDTDRGGYWIKKSNPSPEDQENLKMVIEIYYNIGKFFLAIEENLQVDIDLGGFQRSLLRARTVVRSAEGRARIAVVQGLIGSYKVVESPCLAAVPTASGVIVEYFQRLTNDVHYLELSKNAMHLGYVEKSKRSLELMRRKVIDLLKNKFFSKAFNQSAKAISLATQVHLPETEVAESLLNRGYLPPIISLLEPISNALMLWEQHSPPLIHADPKFNEELVKTDDIHELTRNI